MTGKFCSEKRCSPFTDHITCYLNLFWVLRSWGVHLNTMATVGADWSASELRVIICLSNSRPLPRILFTVGEVGVSSLACESTLTYFSLGCLWKTSHAKTWEDALAHCWPVIVGQHLRPHNVVLIFTWNLEETILSAVLVSPLTTGGWSVDRWWSEKICIVITWIYANRVISELYYLIKDHLIWLIIVLFHQTAEFSSVSVLNALNKNIGVIEHKIVGSHIFWGWIS